MKLKKLITYILLAPMLGALSIFFLAPAAQAEPLTCNMQTFSGEDDVAHQMNLPFTLYLGETDYNTIFLTTNATMTFGTPDANYWSYPSTPSVSLAGWDWVTWGEGAYVSYGYNSNSFCIEWSVRPFPQSTGDLTQIRLVVQKFNNNHWHGEIVTFGWVPENNRRGIVAFQNGEPVTMAAAFDVNLGIPVEVAPAPVPTDFNAPVPTYCPGGTTVYAPDPCPPYIPAPGNLSYTIDDNGNVNLSWTGIDGTVAIERYAISWSTTNFTSNGWGISSTSNSATVTQEQLSSTGGLNTTYQFRIRSDNDSTATYSAFSNSVETFIAGIPTPEPTSPVQPTEPPAPSEPPSEPTPEPSQPSEQPSPTPTETLTPSPAPSASPSESQSQPQAPETTPSPTPEPETSSPEPSIPAQVENLALDQDETSIVLPQDNNITPEFVVLDNGVVLEYEVAEALEVFENIDLFLAAALTDPGKILTAFVNVGADMTPEQRKESQQVTISVIIYAQLMNGLSAANMLMRRI